MADTTRRICYACGKEEEIYKMIEFTTGRTKFICWDCYRQGHSQAAQHELSHKRKGEKKK